MVGRIAKVRWAAHGREISTHLFSIFKNMDAESDCLLSCVGGRLFPAHRIVLAMASPFFSTIFESFPTGATASPLVVLDGVEADQVEALMQYMYSGYSIVKCEKLPALCRTAKALGIKEFPSLEIAPPVKRPFNDKDEVEITPHKSYPQKEVEKNEVETYCRRTVNAYKNNNLGELEAVSESRNVRRKLDSGLSAEVKIADQNYQVNQQPIRSFNYHHMRASNMEARRLEDSTMKFTKVSENKSFVPNEFVAPRSSRPSYGKPFSELSTAAKRMLSYDNSKLRAALYNPAPVHHPKRQRKSEVEPLSVKLEETPELVDVCTVSDDEPAKDIEVQPPATTTSMAPRSSEMPLKTDDSVKPNESSGFSIRKSSEQHISARSSTEPVLRSVSPFPTQIPANEVSHRPNSLPSMAMQPLSATEKSSKQSTPQFHSPSNLYNQKSDNSVVTPQNGRRVDGEHPSSGSGKPIIYVPTPVYGLTPLAKICPQFTRSDSPSYAVSPCTPREPGLRRAKGENMLREESALFKADRSNSKTSLDARAHQMPVERERSMNNCSLELDANTDQFYKNTPPAVPYIRNGEPSSLGLHQSSHSSFPSELPRKTCSNVYDSTSQYKNVPSYSSVPSSGPANTPVTAASTYSVMNKNTALSDALNLPGVDIIQLDGRPDELSKPDGERHDNLPPTSDSITRDSKATPSVSYAPTGPASTIPYSVNSSPPGHSRHPEQDGMYEFGEISDSRSEHGVNDPLLTKISSTKRSRVRGPKSWEFLLRLLRDPTTNPSLIRWENESEGVFRLVKPDAIALRWGKRTGKHFTEMLSYENFARGLRYHYVTGALSAVSERCFVYKFGPKAESVLKSPEKLYDFPAGTYSYE